MARFRDFDGVTRKVEARATATSKNDRGAKAERLLIAALTDRAMPAGEDITGDMRITKLAPIWWADLRTQAGR